MKVRDLLPGDVFDTGMPADLGETRACFIAQTDHPVFAGLRLVIWRMAGGRWSHDALSIDQELYHGELVERGGVPRCRAGLLGEGEWGES